MKKNYKKRKIRILYLLIFFTSMLLTTTTYAWFTTTKIVSLETFNIHVASDGGIQISSDGITWKAILEVNDLYNAHETYAMNINQMPKNFEPVSTAGITSNGLLSMFSGSAVNKGDRLVLVSSKLNEKLAGADDLDSKFIAFDIFLKTESKKALYLSSNSGVKNISDNPTGIENAFRVAFLNQGNVSSETSINVIQNLKKANNVFIWEPNYDTHTSMSVQNASNLYGMNIRENNESLISYYGVVNEIKESDNILIQNLYSSNYPNFLREVSIDLATTKKFDTNKYMFELNPGITKFRVYIWIEGQDVDCEDSASLGDIAVNLQVTTMQ